MSRDRRAAVALPRRCNGCFLAASSSVRPLGRQGVDRAPAPVRLRWLPDQERSSDAVLARYRQPRRVTTGPTGRTTSLATSRESLTTKGHPRSCRGTQ